MLLIVGINTRCLVKLAHLRVIIISAGTSEQLS
jgi:hypothetical protein